MTNPYREQGTVTVTPIKSESFVDELRRLQEEAKRPAVPSESDRMAANEWRLKLIDKARAAAREGRDCVGITCPTAGIATALGAAIRHDYTTVSAEGGFVYASWRKPL